MRQATTMGTMGMIVGVAMILAAGTMASRASAEVDPGSSAQGASAQFVDADGDGICDNTGQRVEMGKGKGKGRGPGDGTGNAGEGPKDGSGYGAQDGSKGNGGTGGSGSGDCDGTGPKGNQGGKGRRGGRR